MLLEFQLSTLSFLVTVLFNKRLSLLSPSIHSPVDRNMVLPSSDHVISWVKL